MKRLQNPQAAVCFRKGLPQGGHQDVLIAGLEARRSWVAADPLDGHDFVMKTR